ncbi:dipeptidase PepE [Salinimicrobium sediminilitoris]|uniref:dipeptidase PepE n=1 Tax=Salinimicrobium sediminilitoris TaxID=2876715 RepID=UPI001E3813EF|nr:dipeptidase PepE [Salinimicrobium sediminilitoris]MCC8358316.1 dipeptidase PepE [Salinimicrobium sediminilitoris]
MKNLILASTSTLHSQEYLEYLIPLLKRHFSNCNKVLFIPYARPGGISHDDYTATAQKAFEKAGLEIEGIHEYDSAHEAVKNAEGIFTGGGNTFLLVQQLYRYDLLPVLKETLNNGTPYLGTSAGTNIAGLTIKTTNDMPIVYPPSFNALGLVPFNINPHYLDPDPKSTHKGETRETRIKEFHRHNTPPVVGLREGSWLEVKGKDIRLKGSLTARVFEANQEPFEVEPETLLNDLT